MAVHSDQGVHSLLEAASKLHPLNIATISYRGNARCASLTTYSQLHEDVHRLAAALRRRFWGGSSPKGRRLALICSNHDLLLTYMYAASVLGLVFVPLNIRWAAPEIARVLADCGAEVVVCDSDLWPLLSSVPQTHLPAMHSVVVLFVDPRGDMPKALGAQVSMITHEVLLAHTSPPPGSDMGMPAGEGGRAEDLHCLVYTSGSTGEPKGVMLSHRSQIVQAREKIRVLGYGPDTLYLSLAPLFHIAGLSSTLAVTMEAGTHVYLDRSNDATAALDAIDRHAVNALVLVPAMLHRLLTAPMLAPPGGRRRAMGSVRTVLVGGQSITKDLWRRAAAQMPSAKFVQSYACSEAASSITFLELDTSQPLPEPLSVGRPASHAEVAIMGSDDAAHPPGQVGEIVTRGPHVMLGYWGKTDVSQRTLRGGWLHTGDLGCWDDGGRLCLKGRMADVIRSGGEDVMALEVERVLEQHQNVATAAVFGVPDEKFGERVVAAVVLTEEGSGLEGEKALMEDMQRLCRQRLAGYKCPKQIVILPALPTTGSGKVLKGGLKQSFL